MRLVCNSAVAAFSPEGWFSYIEIVTIQVENQCRSALYGVILLLLIKTRQ